MSGELHPPDAGRAGLRDLGNALYRSGGLRGLWCLRNRLPGQRDRAEHVTPHVAAWFEDGDLPVARDLAKQFGELGLLGMQLHGHGCGGVPTTVHRYPSWVH
ncbi:glutaryl-CoA dehydrogenase [Mycobacterium tuberculosis]|nr:glutaryl-CoA dehydrogenase [Mycobacterium tuberculosis]